MLLLKQKYKILAFLLKLNLGKGEHIHSYARLLKYQFEQYTVLVFMGINKFYLSLLILSKTR